MSDSIRLTYQDSSGKVLADCFQANPIDCATVKGTKSTRYIYVQQDLNSKKLPELYSSSELCCGCSACYAACPLSGDERNMKNAPTKTVKIWDGTPNKNTIEIELTGAISMLPDAEGFFYPVVDASICIRCYRCLKVCAFKQFEEEHITREQNKYE